jgi:TPR repeat protein
VQKDEEQAGRLHQMAVEAMHGLGSNFLGQTILGDMYQHGRYVAQDYAEAVKWYERAANDGYGEAQYHLASMYGRGMGVERNEDLAKKWLTAAAEQGRLDACVRLGTPHGRQPI